MRKRQSLRPIKTSIFSRQAVESCLLAYESNRTLEDREILESFISFPAKAGNEKPVLDYLQEKFESTRDRKLFVLFGEAILKHAGQLAQSRPEEAAVYVEEVAQGASGTPLGDTAAEVRRSYTHLGPLRARSFEAIRPGLATDINNVADDRVANTRRQRIADKLFSPG